jgi:hypothetical protein
LCNNVANWNTFREDVDIKVAHINPTLIVVLTSNLDEHADNVNLIPTYQLGIIWFQKLLLIN